MIGTARSLIPMLLLLGGGDEPESRPGQLWRTLYEGPEAEIRFRGRVIADLGIFDGDELEEATGVPIDDGTDLRQARLGIKGSLFRSLDFGVGLELATDDPEFRDAWVQLGRGRQLAGTSIRMGHFREPMGLQANTARPQLAFVERSAPVQALTPGRNLGAMAHGTLADERASWALGAFLQTDSRLSQSGSDHSVTGRVTGRPWLARDGRGYVHLGASASHRETDDGGATFNASPGVGMLDAILGTGSIPADSVGLMGLETAWVRGPVSIQGELLGAAVDVEGAPNANLRGAYLQAGWFPTGESRPYDPPRGSFGTLHPDESWWRGEGPGAWELVARWSRTDLDDGGASSDIQRGLELGVNWYLDAKTRVMLDVMRIELDGVGESAGLAVLRLQLTL